MATKPDEGEKEFDLIRDLKVAIRDSGLSLSKLGRMCDINTTQLSRFMSGSRGLNLTAADKICRTLELRLMSMKRKKSKP